MLRIPLLATIIITLSSPFSASAEIKLDGPMSPPSITLPDNPTELLDKAVDSLPQSEEELKAVGSKIKESLGTETGQKVRSVIKDVGRAFVWATELMIKGIKYLLDKL